MSSHNQPCPQYEVEIEAAQVARPTSWTPVREQKLKPRAPRLPRGRPVGERARHWRQMMDEGLYLNMSELARAEGVTPAAVSKALLRLAQPAAG